MWNGGVHAYGPNARVHYSTEVEDELITPFTTLPSRQPTTSWLRGWNFTTDLYRTLEHASNRLRAHHAGIDDRIDVFAVFGMPAFSAAVLASITAHYATLSAHFKEFAPPTGVPVPPEQQQHPGPGGDVGMGIGTVRVGHGEGRAPVAGMDAEGEFLQGWLGEFQLPAELLEDWPWPFNLQPESWSFLGSGGGAREGGW